MSPRGIYERKPRVKNKFAVVKRTLADDSFRAVTAGCLFVIEKGIDIPPKPVNKLKGESIYPFKFMKVGDSFLAKTDEKEVKQSTLSSMVNNFRKSNKDTKFTVRKTAEGLRCWRIA